MTGTRQRVCLDDGNDCTDVDPMTMVCRICGARVIGPMSAPQSDFLESEADIAIYGGGAGGGKTWMLALDAAQDVDVAGYAGIIFRRTSPELVGGGSIWEATQQIYRDLQGRPRTSPTLDWNFPAGSMIELRHLQHDSDIYSHQGKQYAFIGFDELTHFTSAQFWYLVSRMRTTCGVKPRLRATCNPDPDSFVRKLIDWWIGHDGLAIMERSGVLRWFVRREDDTLDWDESKADVLARNPGKSALSMTFIPARLADNPVLVAKDPGYIERLDSLPKVERDRLRGGDWNSRPSPGNYFKKGWFRVVPRDMISPSQIATTIRCWDKAATEPSSAYPNPDWTRGGKVSLLRDGRLLIHNIVGCRKSPGGVDAFMRATAEADGIAVAVKAWEDPGQAGKVDTAHMGRLFTGFSFAIVKANEDKETYAGPWSSLTEQGRVLVEEGDWNDEFFAEVEAFPEKRAKKDQVDCISLAAHVLISGVVEYAYDPIKPERDRHESRPVKSGQGWRSGPGVL